MIERLKDNDIMAVFHYVPFHSVSSDKKFGFYCWDDNYTSSENKKLVKLPLLFDFDNKTVSYIIQNVLRYFADD